MFKNAVKLLFLLCFLCKIAACHGIDDPLPSWNDGKTKQAIIQFINETTTSDSKDFISPQDRIAVFDQDGTLWVEQPIYTQFVFAIDRVRSQAAAHPEWKDTEPYKSIIEGNFEKIKEFTIQDIEKIIAVTHSGMTVEQFNDDVKTWLSKAVDPRFKKSYTELIYQPMLEVIKFFKDHGYIVYIVSGGGQEFIRTYSERVYGVPVENVVGTAGKVKYEYRDGKPVLIKLPDVLFIDDKTGKPEAINLVIGKRPVAAFGNSDGDRQMLEWSQGYAGKSLQLLVHHDDAVREYQYDKDSKIGTFSQSLMDEAKEKEWSIASMKNDWKVIFTNETDPKVRE